jgi:hypothetical protein
MGLFIETGLIENWSASKSMANTVNIRTMLLSYLPATC